MSDPPTPAEASANHATANDKVVVSANGQVVDGRFSVTLSLPSAGVATGPYYLKGYAENAAADAMGSVETVIRR